MAKWEIDLSRIDPDLLARVKLKAKKRGMTLDEAVEDAMRLLFTPEHEMRDPSPRQAD